MTPQIGDFIESVMDSNSCGTVTNIKGDVIEYHTNGGETKYMLTCFCRVVKTAEQVKQGVKDALKGFAQAFESGEFKPSYRS